jgi:hypothetical protein
MKEKEIDYDLWSNVSSPVYEKGYPSYEAVNRGAPVTLTQQRLQQATPPKTDRNLLTLP